MRAEPLSLYAVVEPVDIYQASNMVYVDSCRRELSKLVSGWPLVLVVMFKNGDAPRRQL